MPTAPDREALLALFDEAVHQINATRDNRLTTEWYSKTGDSVFEAGCLALADFCRDANAPRRLHVVSAPAGGGKTSFAYALIMAVTRCAEVTPDAPYGCAFVVDQITKADEVYRELNALLPGKVAIWTTEHDRASKQRQKVPNPAAEFTQDELRLYPVIVVTHAFYNGPKGNKAHLVVRDGRFQNSRALIVVDERPEEVTPYEITLKEAQAVRDALEEKQPAVREYLAALMLYMIPYSLAQNNNCIGRPAVDFGGILAPEQLRWFATEEAETILKHHRTEIPGLDQLFGFARALTLGCAFVAPDGAVLRFVGWQSKLIVRPGMILLDATADIDGVSHICPWREHINAPRGNYRNLDIVLVPQHTKTRLNKYFEKATNQRSYVKWMIEIIRQRMAPGERGLVVCKKALLDAERVPQWPEGDERFKTPGIYTREYGWDVEGRKLCVTHWGTGIGCNDWKDADVVFLFDEFIIPRRIAAATTQGLRGHRADQGDLGSMTTLNCKAAGVDIIAKGHSLRWTKQMALRGRGRSYDEHGVCGKQRLVISSELKSLLAHISTLFPGANVRGDCNLAEDSTWTLRVLEILSKPELPEKITTSHIGQLLGKPWREVSSNVLTPEVKKAFEGLGWCYVPKRGRGGGCFERTKVNKSLAA